MTPDEELFDEIISDALDILRLAASEQSEMLIRLQALQKKLLAKLNEENLNDLRKADLQKLLTETDKIIEDDYISFEEATDFAGISETVADKTAQSVQIVLGLDEIAVPTASYFSSVASNVLIQGAPSAAWWQSQAADIQFKFANQVRQGLVGGETNQSIVSRIVGKFGQPGVMDIARRNALTLVHTSVQTVANDARRKTFQANSDVIKGLRQVSTLDSHTSDICIAYSGAEWDLEFKPINGNDLPYNGGAPRHFNCRSVDVPITKSFRELGLDIDEPKSTTRASDEGQLPAGTSFDDFLKRKGTKYQDEVLGVGRADLWRDGKITLRDLVGGNGRPLSLEALRAKSKKR